MAFFLRLLSFLTNIDIDPRSAPVNNKSTVLEGSATNQNEGSPEPLFLTCLRVTLTILAVAGALYFAVKWTFDYITANALSVKVNFHKKRVARVGETITLKITLSKIEERGREVVCDSHHMKKLDSSISIKVEKAGLERPIAVLKSLTEETDGFLIRFSVRKSGVYDIVIKSGYFNFIGSPFLQEILPGPMFPSRTILNVPNPCVICIIADKWHQIEMNPQDRYGNACTVEDANCKKFQLNVKFGEIPVDSSTEMETNFLHQGKMLVMKMKITNPNIYKGQITFDGIPIEYGDFLIVAMSPEEDKTLQAGFSGMFNPLPGPFKGSLFSVGSKRQNHGSEAWVNVNCSQIAISSLILGMIYYPFIAFRITRRTQILDNGLFEIEENENENRVSLRISDGVQPSVIIVLKGSDARILLATFSTFQGRKLTNYQFSDKVNALKHELRGFLSYFHRPTVMQLDRDDVLASTIQHTIDSPIDWLKPLVIAFKGPMGNNDRPNSRQEFLSMEKWLVLMVQNLFEDQHSAGLFSKYGSSGLLHPTLASRRNPSWKIHHYEFAGSILAKCVYDSHLNGLCMKLNHIRFTKSFLAQLVGIPVTYKHFETDDPTYNCKYVKPLLDSEDDEVVNLNFTDIDDSSSRINLIPNGANIPVTKRNKYKYLNLLSNHKLRNLYSEEFDAFRIGFYKIIPQGLLTDFDEDEIEKVLCSGCSGFEIEDLKTNSRIVGDIQDGPGSSVTKLQDSEFPESEQKKIILWLWTVVANMTDSEREKLLRKATGSLVLPSCGFKELVPKFTISLTGNHEKLPTGHPSLNQLSLGNHSSFEKFEKNFLTFIHGQEDPFNKHESNMTSSSPSSSAQLTETVGGGGQPEKLNLEVLAEDRQTGSAGVIPWDQSDTIFTAL